MELLQKASTALSVGEWKGSRLPLFEAAQFGGGASSLRNLSERGFAVNGSLTRHLSCQFILRGRLFGAWGVGTFGLDWGRLCAPDRRIPFAVDGKNLAPPEADIHAMHMQDAPLAHPNLNIDICCFWPV